MRSPDAHARPADPGRRARLAVTALSLGTALNPLNSSMIAVALLALQHDFGLDIVQVSWVITVFYIASVVGQPLMGRVVDAFGARRTFVAGMIVVLVAAVVAPIGGSFLLVCVSRGLMAIGTSVAFPAAVALVGPLGATAGTGTVRLLGRIQITNTAGAALGPVVGGLLVTFAGWQAVFLVNLPLAVLSGVGVAILAPRDAPRTGLTTRAVLRLLDPPGVIAFAIAAIALLLAVLDPAALAAIAGSGSAWWLTGIGVAALALFVWREWRAAIPFIDVRMLLRSRTLGMVYLAFTVFNATYYLAFFGVPQLLESRGEYSSAVTGLLLLPLAASTVALAPYVARVIDRRGVAPVLVAGAVMLVGAAVVLVLGAFTTAPVWMLVMSAAMGVPYCAVSLALTQALQRSAPREALGVASGLLQSTRYIGAISATVVLGRVLAGGITPAGWVTLTVVAAVLASVHLVVVLVGVRVSASR